MPVDISASFQAILANSTIYDISPVFDTNMPGWHSHPSMGIVRDARNFSQNGYFAQTLVMSEHTGSHVDAPSHGHDGMGTVDELPIDNLIGPYKKYDFVDMNLNAGDYVTLDMVKRVEERLGIDVAKGDIVLVDFGWDKYYLPDSNSPEEREWWGKNEPGLSAEVCKYFYECDIRAIGFDTAGGDTCVVDGRTQSLFGHSTYFLPNGIPIIEGLRNLTCAPSTGFFIALPLKIKGGSGSPIRPILLA